MARPHRRRFALLAVLPLLAATSCAIQPETAEFLVDPSGLTAVLQSSCSPDPVQGPLHVSVSDRNAHAYITEPDRGRIWVRNPMGLVADHCYWVTTDTEREGWPAESRPDCFVDELRQDGTCPGDALAPPEWLFIHGGFIDVPEALLGDALPGEGDGCTGGCAAAGRRTPGLMLFPLLAGLARRRRRD